MRSGIVFFSITFSITLLIACQAPLLDAPAEIAVVEGRTSSFTFSVDEGADVQLRVSSPDLIVERAASEIALRAPVDAVGGTITITAKTDQGVSEAVVSVVVTPLAFTRVEWSDEGPRAREHGSLFVSDDGATVYLLGGGGYPNFPAQEMLADAWQLDVDSGAWSAWPISGDVPPAAASRRTAQAPGNVGFLYGGYDGDFASLDELYRVDLSSGVFTRLDSSGPPARSLHAFAFDASSSRFVVYGGFFDNGVTQDILADTWIGALEGDVVTWSEVTGGPPARYGMFAGLDDKALVVFSGAGFPTQSDPINAYDDTWLLDLDTLTWREADATPPPGRRNGCGVMDPVTHALFVFGGTSDGRSSEAGLFAFDVEREQWSSLQRDGEPPLRSSGFGAPLPGGGVLCGMGNDDDTYRDLFWLR